MKNRSEMLKRAIQMIKQKSIRKKRKGAFIDDLELKSALESQMEELKEFLEFNVGVEDELRGVYEGISKIGRIHQIKKLNKELDGLVV